ncbi:septum formation family protein [Polymorphospora sp. NPDC050346]|uniref:septum formation family protein n=1 Tax=Polymorphospora sp. NPDC050346 TaxID=3155780 RepID=UPI0033F1CB75
MRRHPAALAACVVLLISGCGIPDDLDRDLTDDWPALAAPTRVTPRAGQCHRSVASIEVHRDDFRPIECTMTHQDETSYVGTFPNTGTRPATDGPAMHAAFDECDEQSRSWLGADWRAAALDLNVRVPTENAWRGGARWFRCDLSQTDDLGSNVKLDRRSSLEGSLTGDSDLLHRCFEIVTSDGFVDSTKPVPCTERHQGEFVGVHTATHGSHAALTADLDGTHRACLRLVAAYAKVPVDGNLEHRAGTIAYPPDEYEWAAGDRGVQCLLWLEDGLSRSVRGGGTRALPIQ